MYFIILEKRNHDKKYIKKLIKDNGSEITNQKDKLNEQMRFYQKLYTSNLKRSNNIPEFKEDDQIPKLSEEQKSICDNSLSIEECGNALSKLENNKSPGSDGPIFINYFGQI